jgi:hypothetical protein
MMSLLKTEREYLRYSEECMELALLAVEEPQRIMLRHIAETWLRLAESVGEALPSRAIH